MLLSPPVEMDHPPTYKRKRSQIEVEEECNRTFTLTSLASDKTLTFEPLSRLFRAHLPLSWLSSNSLHDNIKPGTILKGLVGQDMRWDYAVLIARQTPNGGLVVLEQVEDNYFVVNLLQPFVTEKYVQDAAIGAIPAISLQMMLHYMPESGSNLQREADPGSESESTPPLCIPRTRKGAVARRSILNQLESPQDSIKSPSLSDLRTSEVRSEMPLGSVETAEIRKDQTRNTVILATPSLDCQSTEVSSMLPLEPQPDMLSPPYLRQRYLDHLYMTKTSLAFYAKGPLSRARARARALDSTMNLSELAAFYRDSVLPTKRMDLKYKESIPKIILEDSLRDSVDGHVRKPKRRTALGKDGLWPSEPDFINRWSSAIGSSSLVVHNQNSQLLRDAIASLRMREAQMQIILILESLSIEAKQRELPPDQPSPAHVDVIKYESIEVDHSIAVPPPKPKKQRNLEADLEALADRLCIWHSIGLEGTIAAEDNSDRGLENGTFSKDRLQNFCTDVVIPFYNSRLPFLCRTVCKTLAGPEVYEQAQKALRLKDATKIIAPGSEVKRRVSSANRTETGKGFTKEESRVHAVPSLARSSTLPALSKLQRQPSENPQRPPSRSSRQASASFANREIDLVADAQATASKKRKLERVMNHKQDLAAAIEALRKPNRHNVSSAYMDEAEVRKLEASRSVQIAATPRVDRRKMIEVEVTDRVPQLDFAQAHAVPSSGLKSKLVESNDTLPRSSSKKKAVLAAIQRTPSKIRSKVPDASPYFDSLPVEPSTNVSEPVSGSCVQSTPTKPRPTISRSSQGASSSRSLIGPQDDQENSFTLPDVALKTMDRAMAMEVPKTIYDTLGWNDDYDV